jgi:hypothetical protein
VARLPSPAKVGVVAVSAGFDKELTRVTIVGESNLMACTCASVVCGHPDVQRCGKPVETVIKFRIGTDEDNFGAEQTTGICDECWDNVKRQFPQLFP